MTADSEKDTLHCVLCNVKVAAATKGGTTIFEENTASSANRTIAQILSTLLHTCFDQSNVHSTSICKRCSKLVNEAGELQNKLEKIRSKIGSLFEKTKKTLNITCASNHSANANCVNNVFDSETLELATPISEKIRELKGKTRKGSVVEETVKGHIVKSEFLSVQQIFDDEDEHLDTDKILVKPDLDASDAGPIEDENIDDEDIDCAPLEDESQIEEVILVKEDSDSLKKEDEVKPDLSVRDGDTYTCAICPQENAEKRDAKGIIAHLKEAHNTRLYICDVCGDQFHKRTDLSHHLDEHVAKEDGDFQCEVCNRIFNNLRLFRIHKRVHYPQAKSWNCDTCGKKYSSKNLLDEHTNIHTGNRPYICETCGKDFASKYTYRAHAKTHEVRPRPFGCDHCPKTFLSLQNLTQHMKTHNGVKEFVCTECGKAFGSAHNLEVHQIVHTGYKPYICRVCGKAFARKAEIRDHERTHTGEKPYQCEMCGATFSQRSNLQSHKRATHYNDKRYKCDECGKAFKRRRLLDYHTKAAHTGERPYKCETCSATFVYPEHFKKHMRIHTGEKPYLCEVCGKAFNSRDNRNAHRFIHSDKKPYECLVCGMGFMRKPLLYTHMQTQGHLNDTIVVNQPRLTAEQDLVIENSQVHLVMEGDPDQMIEGEGLIVAEFDNHVILQDGNEQILSLGDDNVSGEENDEIGDEQMEYDNSDDVDCKIDGDDEMEEIYGYQDEDGNTIVLPPGADINEILGVRKMQLVQIRLPAGAADDDRNWLSIAPSSSS
ncbi:hypothetical protein QAD02_017077 [Eretmocerus hayati]|uniref:Uncharacterized protein n=1 Tax=Eretmocerus hayati TaxID=131215 RepID=A0ACC2PD03_9HYME|nr:hypothetical protein QAD02_017077 [Eretmocerus hayati]